MARGCVSRSINKRRISAGKNEFALRRRVFGLVRCAVPIRLADFDLSQGQRSAQLPPTSTI